MPDPTSSPQIVTALVGLGGVLVGSLISWGVQARLLGRRINADEALAALKFAFDKEIAERKFKYDRDLHDHKRKTELAEQALTAFYEAREAFVWARSRGIFGGEGGSRAATAGESKTQQDQRNTYFIPIERLTHEKELFARLRSLRYVFAAQFGETAIEPFKAIWGVHVEIMSSASLLIQITPRDDNDGGSFERNAPPLLETLWGGTDRPDAIDRKIEQAIEDIEKVCLPVLSGALTE